MLHYYIFQLSEYVIFKQLHPGIKYHIKWYTNIISNHIFKGIF